MCPSLTSTVLYLKLIDMLLSCLPLWGKIISNYVFVEVKMVLNIRKNRPACFGLIRQSFEVIQQNGCLDDDEMNIYRVNKDGGETGVLTPLLSIFKRARLVHFWSQQRASNANIAHSLLIRS